MISVYYHAYLDDNFLWSQLLLEKFKAMEDSGLKEKIKKMTITAITQNDKRVEIFYDFCKLQKMPIDLEFIKNQYANDYEMINETGDIFNNRSKNIGERYTQKKLYDDCQKEDQIVLYLHAKGITSIVNNLTVPGLVSKYRNRYYWRLFMNKTILDWEKCVDALQGEYDTAGLDYSTDPSEHYRGNFFWTKSSHVRKLPVPDTNEWWHELKARKNHPWLNQICDRFAAEMWVCSLPETKSFNSRSNNGDYIANDI